MPTLANLFSKLMPLLQQSTNIKAGKPGLDKCQIPKEDMQWEPKAKVSVSYDSASGLVTMMLQDFAAT